VSLKEQAIGGVKWTMISSLTNILLQVIQLIILAQILSPIDFGLMAIVMVVIGFSQLFVDMGVSNAIIFKQNISTNELSSLYWLNVFIGIGFFFIILITSPIISAFYENDKLTLLIDLVAITFLIKPFGQQYMMLLHKEMQFKSTSIVEVISKVISFTSIIILAFNDFGVYSLAIGSLINAIGTTLGYNYFGRKIHKPNRYFKKRELKEFLSFGLFQMGDKFLNYFALQMDTILIGKLLGIEILGIYNIAKDLTSKPYAVINPIITKVTFPMLSKIGNDSHNLKKVYLKTINYLAFLNFPIYLLIAFYANEIVFFMFGEIWVQSVPVIQILSISFALRSIGNPAGSLLLSKGKANVAFYWNLILFSSFPIFIYLGSFWGILGVAFAILSIQVSLFFPNWYFIVKRYTEIEFKPYIIQLLNPVIFSVFALILPYLLLLFTCNNWITIILSALCFCVIYLLLIIIFETTLLINSLDILPNYLSIRIKNMKVIKHLNQTSKL